MGFWRSKVTEAQADFEHPYSCLSLTKESTVWLTFYEISTQSTND